MAQEPTASNKIITISDYYYKKTEIDTMMNGKANTTHTHTTSEITDFPVIPDVSNYIQKSSTTGFVKNDGRIDSNEYVTNQELYENMSINYVVTATDSTFTEGVSTFIVGGDYYFIISAFQAAQIGAAEMPVTDIRCEIVHSGATAELTPVKSDNGSVTCNFTPTEQGGYILKVYYLNNLVATYTFDAIIDSGWQEVTFKSGYSRYNDSNSVYIRRKGDFVELTGAWKPTTTKSASLSPVPFALIPSDLKPKNDFNMICPGKDMKTYVLTVIGTSLSWSRHGTNTSTDLEASDFGTVHCTWTV